jgi:hypothetical protein
MLYQRAIPILLIYHPIYLHSISLFLFIFSRAASVSERTKRTCCLSDHLARLHETPRILRYLTICILHQPFWL